MNIDCNIEIDPAKFACKNSASEAIEFVKALDLHFAEVDFTINLILSLLDSLKEDLTLDELSELLNEIKKVVNKRGAKNNQ